MENPLTPDRLRSQDLVRVTIINSEDHVVHTYMGDGYTRIISAIHAAWNDWTAHTGDMRDYCYQVDDLGQNISHRYRINAHGNLHLDV